MNYTTLYAEKRGSYYSEARTDILHFVPDGIKKALDIGCGNGSFGKALKEKFECTVWGVEPDENSAVLASEKIDIVLNALFESDLDFRNQRFDCIFFNDVLEHLVDPYSGLLKAKFLLESNGYIISSIPNILHFFTICKILETQDWRYEDAGIMDRTHLRFFTRKSIVRMFDECGLRILKIQGINPTYGKKYRLINALLMNKIKDMKYRQYIIIATPK